MQKSQDTRIMVQLEAVSRSWAPGEGGQRGARGVAEREQRAGSHYRHEFKK